MAAKRGRCIAAPASRSSRQRRGFGEDAVDESSRRYRRVEVRQVGLDEAPESMKHEDEKSPMLPPFARRSNLQRNPRCQGLHWDIASVKFDVTAAV